MSSFDNSINSNQTDQIVGHNKNKMKIMLAIRIPQEIEEDLLGLIEPIANDFQVPFVKEFYWIIKPAFLPKDRDYRRILYMLESSAIEINDSSVILSDIKCFGSWNSNGDIIHPELDFEIMCIKPSQDLGRFLQKIYHNFGSTEFFSKEYLDEIGQWSIPNIPLIKSVTMLSEEYAKKLRDAIFSENKLFRFLRVFRVEEIEILEFIHFQKRWVVKDKIKIGP